MELFGLIASSINCL